MIRGLLGWLSGVERKKQYKKQDTTRNLNGWNLRLIKGDGEERGRNWGILAAKLGCGQMM